MSCGDTWRVASIATVQRRSRCLCARHAADQPPPPAARRLASARPHVNSRSLLARIAGSLRPHGASPGPAPRSIARQRAFLKNRRCRPRFARPRKPARGRDGAVGRNRDSVRVAPCRSQLDCAAARTCGPRVISGLSSSYRRAACPPLRRIGITAWIAPRPSAAQPRELAALSNELNPRPADRLRGPRPPEITSALPANCSRRR